MVLSTSTPSSVRHNYGQIADKLEVGNLIQTQLNSFAWFCKEGLRELFDEINPITDYTGKNYELRFLDYEFGTPKYDEEECRQRDMTFSAPLRINTRLHIKTGENAGEIKETEVFMGDFPMMTPQGTFIVNGTERVVVSQLVRSPGVYFTAAEDRVTGRILYSAKLIPNRGAWLEIETSNKDVLTVKIDRKRKVPVTTLVRALGYAGNDDIRAFFADADNDPEHTYIQATLEKDATSSVEEALIELYRKIRPGDPPTVENARNLLSSLFFNPRRFDLSKVGRFKLDKNLGIPEDEARERALDKERRVLDNQDFVSIVRKLISLNNGLGEPDDIDHLGNRRVRAVGELLQNQFRMGLIRMERIIKERMTICDAATVTAASLINARPVVAAIKEFFGSSQLSQFMDQTNPLAELTHKRRLSALGPGGLSRERAGFDVRDVHYSHYGRICPIETPEGPNIGLMGSLATFAKVNEFGFIVAPFRRVYRDVSAREPREGRLLAGQTLREDVELAERRARARRRGRPAAGREGGRAGPHRPLGLGRDRLPLRRRGGQVHGRPGQRAGRRGRSLHRRPHRLPEPAHLQGPARGRGRLHGRLAQADGLGGDRAHPLPRARRRQPGADGFEHAEAGGPPAGHRGPHRRHRHGGPRRPQLRRDGHLPGDGDRGRRLLARAGRRRPLGGQGPQRPGRRHRHPGAAGRRRSGHLVRHPQVRAQQPGDLPLPAHLGEGREHGSRPAPCWPTAPPPTAASWPWAATCWSPSCRGRATTSRTPS